VFSFANDLANKACLWFLPGRCCIVATRLVSTTAPSRESFLAAYAFKY